LTAVGDVLALQRCIYEVAAAAALHTSASDASLSSHSWFGWPCCEGSQIVLHIEVVTIIITSNKGGKCFSPCSFVCLSVSHITQKCEHGFGEMLRVDRCLDMDELMSPIRIAFSDIV